MAVAIGWEERKMGSYSIGIKFQLYEMNESRDLLYNLVPIANNTILCI